MKKERMAYESAVINMDSSICKSIGVMPFFVFVVVFAFLGCDPNDTVFHKVPGSDNWRASANIYIKRLTNQYGRWKTISVTKGKCNDTDRESVSSNMNKSIGQLWSITGQPPFGYVKKNGSDWRNSIPDIIEGYSLFITNHATMDIVDLQVRGIREAVKLIDTPIWGYAVDYLNAKIEHPPVYIHTTKLKPGEGFDMGYIHSDSGDWGRMQEIVMESYLLWLKNDFPRKYRWDSKSNQFRKY